MRSFGAVVLIVSALAGVAVGVWSPVSEGRRVKAAGSASYPLTPFALPSLVTMLARGGGNSVWVGRIGSVDRLAARPDGTLTQVEALDVGAGSRPSAMVAADQNCDQYRFVLQAQNDVLQVFEMGDPHPFLQLPVGADPVAVTVGRQFVGEWTCFVAVADAGSNDLAIYSYSGRVFSAMRRVAVGMRPLALAIAQPGVLAVANSGSGTVTLLDASSQFEHLGELPVGGTPSVLAARAAGSEAFNTGDDLIVGDGASSRISVWLGADPDARPSTPRFTAGPVLMLPHPMSRASAVAVADVNDDSRGDVAAADRHTGAVFEFDSVGPRRFAPARVALGGVDPLGLAAGRFGGDFHRDVAVADASTNTVRLALTPGDRLIARGRGIQNLAAGAGRLAWSQRTSRGLHTLETQARGATSKIPVTPSSAAFAPRLGSRAGRPVITYIACRRSGCRPYLWDLRSKRERRLAVPQHTVCRVTDIAVWDGWTAIELERRGHHRCRSGLWVAHAGRLTQQRPRLHLEDLGDLRAGYLVRSGYLFQRGTGRAQTIRWELLVGRVGRRPRRLARLPDGDEGSPTAALLGGHFAYWQYTGDDFVVLLRTPITGRHCRPQVFPAEADESTVTGVPGPSRFTRNFAVSGQSVYYTDGSGVFQIDPARLRWANWLGLC